MIRSIFFMMLFFLSCSSITFKSDSKSKVHFDTIPNIEKENTKRVEVDVRKDFYFWGTLPKINEIFVDKEFIKQGYADIKGFNIKEIKIVQKITWFIFSLGFYYPESYRLSGFQIIK